MFGLDDLLLGLAVGGVMSGVGAALAPKPPGAPDLAGATQAGVQADLDTLPMRRKIEAAAKLGTKVSVDDPNPTFRKGKAVNIGTREKPNMVPYVASEWAKGGKYYGKPRPAVVDHNFPVQAQKEYDFTGRGDIDTEVDQAKKLAASNLELQQKYGEEFIKENLRQQALADPESKAAREKLAALIEQERTREAVNPLALKVQEMDRADLASGGELTQSERDAVMATLLKRRAMGDDVDQEAVSRTFDVGREARDTQRQQQMLGLLTSGASPTDVTYRKEQQDLANMASYRAGKTPVSQFQTMSGAQTGATPQMGTTRMGSNVDPNAGDAGAASARNQYGMKMDYASTQANPWFAGVGVALKGASALGAGGFKPFG